MATTTNYGWTTPDDTALVKDGAAAIRTLGSSVDTTTKALNPSTTLGDIEYRSSTANTNTRLGIGTAGQVLAVVGGVPAWATTADQTPLTTKGDIFTFTTVDARLGVGANGTVLTADSAEATGLKWATPSVSASGLTLISTTSFTTASSVSTGSVFSATYTNYKIFITITASSATNDLNIRLRTGGADNSTAGNYLYQNFTTGGVNNSDAHGSSWSGASATSFAAGSVVSNAGFQNRFVTMELLSPFETFKTGYSAEALSGNAGPYDYANKIIGRMDVTTSYDAFTIIPGSGTITGKVSVYGYAI